VTPTPESDGWIAGAPTEEPVVAGHATVLLVEDEADLASALTADLEAQGYAVLTALDGIAALEMAQQALPQIILLDLMLPKVDGYRVLKLLKADERCRQIPIVVITARAGQRDLELAVEAGADACLVKPVRPETLFATLRARLAPEGR